MSLEVYHAFILLKRPAEGAVLLRGDCGAGEVESSSHAGVVGGLSVVTRSGVGSVGMAAFFVWFGTSVGAAALGFVSGGCGENGLG